MICIYYYEKVQWNDQGEGFSGGHDDSRAVSWVAWGGTSAVMVSSTGIVSSTGALGSDGLGISVWGGARPRCCCIWLRIAVYWSRIIVCRSYWARMSLIFRNRASCVALLNNNTMPRNSEPDMVIKSYNGGSAAGGTGGVAGGSVEMAWGIDGVAGVDGIDSVGCSSYYAWSGYAGTGDTSLGVVA